jgi:Zn-dependent protease with chaperone function
LKWPALVAHWPAWFGLSEDISVGGLVLSGSMVIGMLLTTGPYLLSMVLSWIPRRRLAASSRGRAIPLFTYLSFEAKMSWLPLSMCVLLAVLRDGFMLCSSAAQKLPKSWIDFLGSESTQTVLLLVLMVIAATVLVPVAAVKLWRCTPLPDGELKERLKVLLEKSGVKARSILVWGGRNSGMLNACVLGPWSRFRYVLISPLLADELSMDETEAVLGHELGHARYGHLTFYMVVIFFMAVLIEPIYSAASQGWKAFPIIQTCVTMAFVIGYIYFFFGALSRQCEREADLASAELIGTPQPLIMALEKLAYRNGNIRAVPCWHHGSIAERVVAVQKLSSDPNASMKFHSRLRLMRIGLTALAVVGLIAAELISHL